jgi:hypothetical protein
MFASFRRTHALATLLLLSYVEAVKQPAKQFIVDTDIFDAIEYVHQAMYWTLTNTTLAMLQRSFLLAPYPIQISSL